MINETKQIKATSKKKLDERVAAKTTTMKCCIKNDGTLKLKTKKEYG